MGQEPEALGEFEQMVLLAVLRGGDQAYGVTVHEELQRHSARRVARGAVYMTLDRLETKGLLTSSLTQPIAARGGKSRRCYRVTPTATTALRATRRTLLGLWDGLEPALEK